MFACHRDFAVGKHSNKKKARLKNMPPTNKFESQPL